jgi:chorismate-pyruvate lyase
MDERDASILAPLAGFYAAAGRTAPVAEAVAATDVPPDIRGLLGPPEALTPRLEDRHGEQLALRVLERRRAGDRYARRIVLVRGDGVPVALGAIVLDLARLDARARAAVLAESVPFGHILRGAVAEPDALLRVACDAAIAAALEIEPRLGGWLYGRRRTIRDATGATVAAVVDILAPDAPPRVRARSTGS